MKIIDSFFALKSNLNSVWQKLTLLFIENSELQVWSTHNKNGEISWYAYDPTTRRSACFGSEDDMRAWIEKRLYL
ncbi:hypothetical protein DSM106972_023480 [Dulcicalothrix desertica PCC 7102]|uniref:Uncharacterized protein n=1 Tax=Dulcicalothrix desertica PCC 7102 TaxID=232991 RepID=A0A433VLZ0_9CYAN|nr:hypothetical protein [Dulcicalothrix desertica]RUT07087.1 hypothetical protein DSM106972_023480 [Dulcicalothrix desertica PCC 7102]TWH61917.1 hypothetical protein CAL7102_00598 [Dulcicalothrix desertica PCC 7102]